MSDYHTSSSISSSEASSYPSRKNSEISDEIFDKEKEDDHSVTLSKDDSADVLKALEEERKRFSALSPLPTLLILSIGPLLTAVGTALHDSCDLLLISKAFGDYGVTVSGLASLVRFFCVGVALYFGDAATLKIPKLIGQNRQEEAKQVICDLFRVSLLVNLVFPFIVYFITEPVLRYMNCPESAIKDSVGYILPIAVTIPFTTLLHLSLGVIQGEGRSIACGLIQMGVFVLNCCILSPIILFGIKAPISWSGVPFGLAHGIPGIILMVLIFQGKFSIKPTWSMWKNPLSKEVFDALKVASSFIVFLLVNTWPPMLLTHYLYNVANNINEFHDINNCFNVLMKINPFVNSFTTGIAQGFMTAGSYSAGAKDIYRFVTLSKWTLLICILLQAIFIPITVIRPWIVARIWLTETENGVYWANRLNKIMFYTQWLQAISEVTNCLCMSFGQGWAPYIPAILKGAVMCGACVGLYDRNKTNPDLQLYVYNICDGVVLVCDIIFFFAIIMPYIRKEKEIANREGFHDPKEESSTSVEKNVDL
ncbi:hypothetical protein TRFO_27206 [Tritrichomonas foetus]|uniref:MatE family protein n=1 Tax=Tritrichomonas foetus TaxID=1144522 RepID=A0A1J4K1S2_9EUKA|nr:hypothetical protein TRFO_27206 [Tritrichomonas foetus]|eukprot:OHT05187.1 hypothetical protein TRFO_27206 [Tritrichomonas foetus]